MNNNVHRRALLRERKKEVVKKQSTERTSMYIYTHIHRHTHTHIVIHTYIHTSFNSLGKEMYMYMDLYAGFRLGLGMPACTLITPWSAWYCTCGRVTVINDIPTH